MASYTATWVGPPSNPAQDDTAEAAEEAATPFEAWTDWLEEARDAIAEGDGDPDDTDTILALVLEHVVGGGPDAVALKEKRAEEILREAQASNGKITVFLHRQREARKTQKAEAAALAKRLDHMADQIGSLTREDSQLRTTLENCEQNRRRACWRRKSRAKEVSGACSTPSAADHMRSASPLSWSNGTPQRPWKS
jgi:predicted RNase H-like nuclease (RuvC/YqgF family)